STMTLLGFPPSNQIGGELLIRADRLWCSTGLFELPVNMAPSAGRPAEIGDVRVVIRPEDIHLNPNQDGLLQCQAQVVLREDLGGEVIVYLEVNEIPLVTVISHAEDHLISKDRVTIGVHPSKVVLFNSETGQRIGP
ncbi:MAG: TOBE domain-containing protein, partial [Desulfobacterales bacterium]